MRTSGRGVPHEACQTLRSNCPFASFPSHSPLCAELVSSCVCVLAVRLEAIAEMDFRYSKRDKLPVLGLLKQNTAARTFNTASKNDIRVTKCEVIS